MAPRYFVVFRTFPPVLSFQRSSVRGVRFTRNVVVPVGAPVLRPGPAMMMLMVEWVLGRVFQVASAHQD